MILYMMSASTAKQPPMNDQQCLFMVESFERRKDIFYNKSNRANASKLKRTAWTEIAEEFNNKFPLNHRDWLGVKKKWENMVSIAKRWSSNVRRSRKQTGGGSPIPDPPSYIKAISDMLGGSEAFTGVGAPIESADEPVTDDQIVEPTDSSVHLDEFPTKSSSPKCDTNFVEISDKRQKRVLNRKRDENTVENLHKDVLNLEKEKLGLEIKKLRLEISYLETKRLRSTQQEVNPDVTSFINMDTDTVVFYDSTNERRSM